MVAATLEPVTLGWLTPGADKPRPRPWWMPLFLVVLVAVQLLRPAAGPGPGDPVHLLGPETQPQQVLLRGHLLSDPLPSGNGSGQGSSCRALLQLAGGRSELSFPNCPPLQQGWSVEVMGRLRRPQPAPHPLLAGPAERLAREGAWSQLAVERFEVLSRPATPIADLRRRIARQLVEALGADRGGLLAALVLGSAVVPLPQALREGFRVAGLSHALAASGFHLTVLLGALQWPSKHLGPGPRLLLSAAAMLVFLLLAGPQPSVLRAVLMGAIALALVESGLRPRPCGVLLATVLLLLLVRPGWLADVGFQLSVAATAGLLLSAGPLQRWLGRWLPEPLAAGLAVPLAASAWTLPLQWVHFHLMPVYAVPANLLAAPLLTPLTLGAMGLALLGAPLPALVPLLAQPLGWLADVLLWLVRLVAGLPQALMPLGSPQPLLALGLAAGMGGLLLSGLRRPWRLGSAALVALVLLLHLAQLRGDGLLLVHQGQREWLVARHGGRAALLSRQGDALSCRQAARLATGLGVRQFDWVLLLDPVVPAEPECWQRQAGLLAAAAGDGGLPLAAGQRLQSPGLVVQPLASASTALQLRIGRRQWVLLPDRQAFWSWREAQAMDHAGLMGAPLPRRFDGLWLGFRPRGQERRALQSARAAHLWFSGPRSASLLRRWQASGASGWLAAA